MTELAQRPHAATKPINLRELGFVYRVSPQALAEIERVERRAAMVITTAHLYLFD